MATNKKIAAKKKKTVVQRARQSYRSIIHLSGLGDADNGPMANLRLADKRRA